MRRGGVRRYVPGTATQHVKGLGAEHMAAKSLATFAKRLKANALAGKSCALVGNSGQLKRVRGRFLLKC
jgi:hypothetical protein